MCQEKFELRKIGYNIDNEIPDVNYVLRLFLQSNIINGEALTFLAEVYQDPISCKTLSTKWDI